MLGTQTDTDDLDSAYEKSIAPDKIHQAKIVSLLGVIAFTMTIIIDHWAIPSATTEIFLARIIIIVTFITTYVTSTFKEKSYLQHYQLITCANFLIDSFLIEYSVYKAQPTELAYYVYFSSLIVVFMVAFSWTYLKLKYLVILTFLIIAGYIFAILSRDSYGPHGALGFLFTTLSILSGSLLFGFAGKLSRDNRMYEIFLLQNSLKEAYNKKEIESDRHKYYATHDTLTGLYNRRYREVYLAPLLAAVRKKGKVAVILFLDLNDFKKINDLHGHDAGDMVLKITANRLKLCMNSKDTLIRMGGDEFLVFMTLEKENKPLVYDIISRIKLSLSQLIIFEKKKLTISVSIGMAASPTDGDDIETLMTIADKRMYTDKTTLRKEKLTT